ncbi:hypothetical protein JW826_04550 [Candidatus Woesearchaeota archaeon]|nr:hypothetical protein [Candidatus Woesearchaeota archaeon]
MAKPKKSVVSKKGQSNGSGNDVACAVLSYLLVGIIWYFADASMKGNAFVKRHVRQGIVLLVLWIAVVMVLSAIPLLGWVLIPIAQILFLILWVIGIIHAATKKDEPMPVLGTLADKIKI